MAVNFDINSFIIDRPLRAIFLNSDDTTAWYTNQVENFSVQVDGEEQQKKDAAGNTIATISKGKTCTMKFDVAVFDLNIIAALNGTKKRVAGTSEYATLNTPCFEEIKITEANKTEIVLARSVRAAGTNYTLSVTTLTKDGSPKQIFKQGSAAAAGVFTYTAADKKITFNDGDLVAGDTVLVVYEYDAEEAVQVLATANDFPKTGKLYVQVKGFDICDQNTVLYAYYRFPTAKLKSSYTTEINLEVTIPMEFDCATDYCGEDKEFYDIVVPNSATA